MEQLAGLFNAMRTAGGGVRRQRWRHMVRKFELVGGKDLQPGEVDLVFMKALGEGEAHKADEQLDLEAFHRGLTFIAAKKYRQARSDAEAMHLLLRQNLLPHEAWPKEDIDTLEGLLGDSQVMQVMGGVSDLLGLVYSHWSSHGDSLASFNTLWRCLTDFSLAPALISRLKLVEIMKQVLRDQGTHSGGGGSGGGGGGNPVIQRGVSAGVASFEEFQNVIVRCASAYARSEDSTAVAEGLGMLVERMEASAGMQKLREAQGAFAADSGAFQRAGEAGRLMSPSGYSPSTGLNLMSKIVAVKDSPDGSKISMAIPRPYYPSSRGYLEGASSRQADSSHLNNEAVEASLRWVSPQKGSSLSPTKSGVGGTEFARTEADTPLPLQPLVDYLDSPDHDYLRELYAHYAATSASGGNGGLGQDGFERFLRESGTWDGLLVDTNTVETVLTQVLGSTASPDSSLSWNQFISAVAMLVQKKAPARPPHHNYHLAAHVAFMPLLIEQLGHFQALSIRLF